MHQSASVPAGVRLAWRTAVCLTLAAVAVLGHTSAALAAEPTASIKAFGAQPLLDGPNTCAGCGAAAQLKLEYELEGEGYGATPANPSGGIPPLSAVKLYLPEGMQEHPAAFGECTMATLQNIGPSGCPENSSVSPFGSTLAEVTFGEDRVPEEAEVKAFVGEGGLLFYEAGHSPVALEVAWKGHFVNSGQAGFGEELTSQLPPIATVPGAPLSSTRAIHLKLGSLVEHSGETIPYLSLPKTCPPEGLSFKTELIFGGEPGFGIPAKTVVATSKVPCPSGGGVKFTSTSLAVSPQTAVTNQTVALKASVSVVGGGTPQGRVTFTESFIGSSFPAFGCEESQPLSQVGIAFVAKCETSFGAAFSPLELGATFESSNLEVEGSKAPVVKLEVGRDSTITTLAISDAAPQTGKPVTYTATVTPAHAGFEIPFGSVEFLERGNPITGCQHAALTEVGTAARAACIVTYKSGGTALVSASYLGDLNFTGSTSSLQYVFVHNPPAETQSAPTPSPVPEGSALASKTAVVSAAQVAALLGGELVPSGKRANIAALLKNGGFVRALRALEGGVATIGWYQVPPGAKVAKQAKPVLVATGRLTFTTAGTATIKIRLTKAGRALLKRVKRAALTARGTFTPAGASPVVVLRRFTLRR
jgi:hypothetical protein